MFNRTGKSMGDDATVVLTDIKEALAAADKEAGDSDRPAALVVVGGDLNGTIFDLDEKEIIAGRSSENRIALDFQGISRYHFKVVQVENFACAIQDMGSKNGTYLNNRKLTEAVELQKGDIVKIGSIAFKYIPKGDPERLAYDKLSENANIDLPTKCYNKMYFNKAADLEINKSKVTGNPLSLILFDLDHFKNLNDNYGHDAGDHVLVRLTQLVRKHGVRESDIFARYGGEEFVLLLPGTNLKLSYEIAERLRKVIEVEQFIYDKKILPVTTSIGISDYRRGVLTGTDLFKRADQALYAAKENGRNQVQFFRG